MIDGAAANGPRMYPGQLQELVAIRDRIVKMVDRENGKQ